jgi:hypothetical protein
MVLQVNFSIILYARYCANSIVGNYLGEFDVNVGKSLNRPTVHWDYGL